MRRPKKPKDFTVTENDTKWPALIGERFRAVEITWCESNGAIPSCAGRMCHFYRREDCWREDYGIPCVWPYYWRKLDKDGNVLDRDGHIVWTKEQADKIEEQYYDRKSKRSSSETKR